jgi:peptide/nickel transport system permease protein
MEALTGTVPYLWLAVLGGAVLGLVVATRRLDWLRAGQVWRHRLLRAGEQLILLVPSVPLPVFAFAAMVLLRGQGLLTLCLCLGSIVALRFYAQILTNYDRSGRLGHWQAHEAIGGSRQQRVIRYGLQREWAAELLHSLAFYLKASIMTEISLSYLGFGVQEPQASFGNLLGSELRTFLNGHWLLLIVSLIVITLTCEAPFAGWRLVRNRFAAGWRLADQHLAR